MEKKILLGKALEEAIKLECDISNATEAETNRAIHLFLIDRFIKYLEEDKKQWQNYEIGQFDNLDIVDSNVLIENIKNIYDDEYFDDMAELVEKHEAALLEKFPANKVENWWED